MVVVDGIAGVGVDRVIVFVMRVVDPMTEAAQRLEVVSVNTWVAVEKMKAGKRMKKDGDE